MIQCPLCRTIQNNWRIYAIHLLETHPDSDRCEWANTMLGKTEDSVSEPEKIRGKLAEMIPPTRIPKYLRDQLGG